MVRAWSAIIKNDSRILQMLEDSRSIYDQALYFQRQVYFESKESGKIKTYSYNALYKLVSETESFKNSNLDYVAKQYCIKQVCNAWSAYIKSVIAYKKDFTKFKVRPKLPQYLNKRKISYNLVQFDKTRFRTKKCKTDEIRLPNSDVILKLPAKLNRNSIKQLTVQKFFDKIKINFVYEDEKIIDNEFISGSAIGVDIGVKNLMAVTINDNSFSYVINGKPLISMNQFFNKKKAELQSKLEICNKGSKSSHRLDKLYLKRKHKIDNYLHCVSKQFLDWCVLNKIETIVIGHNKQWKQNCNLGRKNNQKFVSIPFNDLIKQIVYKSEYYKNLKVKIVEESYTSKTDHLAFEEMRNHETYKGERVKRGLFKSSIGKTLNADINGAIGILRKANAISDVQLLNLRDRGDVVSPKVFKINL